MLATRRSVLLGGAALTLLAAPRPAFAQGGRPAVTLVRQATGLYVRTAWRADPSLDQVRRFLVDRPVSPTASQCLDDAGLSLIPASTPADQTVAVYDQQTRVLSGDEDQAAPAVYNGEYQGANHGVTAWQIRQTAHGKTALDVGSVWNDGAFDFVLAQIIDADAVAVVLRPTGDDEKWVKPQVPPQGPLRHVSGATNTQWLPPPGIQADISFRNLHPLLQGYEQSVLADGVRPVPMGVSTCDHVVLSERYRIPNLKAMVDRLVSLAGSGVAPSFNDDAIASQAGVEVSYRIDWTGGVQGDYAFTALQPNRFSGQDYLGGMQLHRPLFPGENSFSVPPPAGWTRAFFAIGATTVYDLGGAVQPGDFTQGLDITPQPQAAFYAVRSEGWGPSTGGATPDAPDRFIELVSQSGAPKHGVVLGYDQLQGDAEPARRRALTNVACTVSTVDKMYPQFRNALAGDMTEGEACRVGFFYGHYAPTSPEWVADILAPAGDATRLYLQRRAGAPLRTWVPCDPRLVGRTVVVDRQTEGVEVLTGAVTERGIEVAFPATAASLDVRFVAA